MIVSFNVSSLESGKSDHPIQATNVDKQGMPLTVRSVFVVDPKNIIRLIITYPASTGRNFDEILRVVDSLQLADKKKIATPEGWRGLQDEVIVHNSVNNEEAAKVNTAFQQFLKEYMARIYGWCEHTTKPSFSLQLFPGFKIIKPYLRTVKLNDA